MGEIVIYNDSKEAIKPLGFWQATNKVNITLSANNDNSPTSVHFMQIPMEWVENDAGKSPKDISGDCLAIIVRVAVNKAPIALNSFCCDPYDKSVWVTVNNPSNKKVTIEPGDIYIDAYFIPCEMDEKPGIQNPDIPEV